MIREKDIRNLKKEIYTTAEQLKDLKRQLHQLENTEVSVKNMRLCDIEDFPNVGILEVIENIANKIRGKTDGDATVGELLMMNLSVIYSSKGVVMSKLSALAAWMSKHNLKFIDKNRIFYVTPDEDELLSSFDLFWNYCLEQNKIMRLYSVLEKIAHRQGKDFYKDYTVGDFLRVDLTELKKECGFTEHTMKMLVGCVNERGLKFYNE